MFVDGCVMVQAAVFIRTYSHLLDMGQGCVPAEGELGDDLLSVSPL